MLMWKCEFTGPTPPSMCVYATQPLTVRSIPHHISSMHTFDNTTLNLNRPKHKNTHTHTPLHSTLTHTHKHIPIPANEGAAGWQSQFGNNTRQERCETKANVTSPRPSKKK